MTSTITLVGPAWLGALDVFSSRHGQPCREDGAILQSLSWRYSVRKKYCFSLRVDTHHGQACCHRVNLSVRDVAKEMLDRALAQRLTRLARDNGTVQARVRHFAT